MKDVLIIAFASQLPGEDGNNRSRFKRIAENLSSEGYRVTEIVSSFRDYDRYQRKNESLQNNDNYKIILLNEPGYIKNISIRRIFSQIIFAKNLKSFLFNSNKYDLIYCCVPTLEAAYVAKNSAKKWKIPFVIDVQDLWPEAMKLKIKNRIFGNILLFPYKLMANSIYKAANGIVACSNTYLDRVLEVNKISTIQEVVYIGTDLQNYNKEKDFTIGIQKNNNDIWITYLGTLGHSYDIDTLLLSYSNIYRDYGDRIKLFIIGRGEKEIEYRELAEKLKIPVIFTGWVDHSHVIDYLDKSDILVNAIKKNAPQSITNKIGDYLSAGKCIANGSSNKEFIEMIDKNNIGINYLPSDTDSMEKALLRLINMESAERDEFGKRARELAEKSFDRAKTYKKINDLVKKLF